VHNVKALAHTAAQMVRHPIDTAINVTSSVGGTARDIAKGGLKKGYNVVRHPLAIPSKIFSVAFHPVRGAGDFLTYCDNIDFNNFPVIGRINEAVRRFSGLAPITAEACPQLHATLQETAHKLGVEATRLYIFKGNRVTDILESCGIIDMSCNAFQGGFTSKTAYTVIGKDLLLGVNRGDYSFIPGLSRAQIQAIFAHELAHQKDRHILKLAIANMVSISLMLSCQYLIVSKSAIILLNKYAIPLLFCAYSRKCEKEADVDSSGSLSNQGDLAAGLSILAFLYATKHRSAAQLFMTHPDNGERLDYLYRAAAQRKQAEAQPNP